MTETRIDGEFPQPEHALMPPEPVYKRWQCFFCGYIYDEALGWPEDGIAPGTSWAGVPDDWICPDCGVDKSHFEMIEIG